MKGSSIIRNTTALFTAQFAGRLLSFILTIVLPRYLIGGFDDLGKYFTALWLTNLITMITELGLYIPVIREISSDRSKASQIISNALAIRLFLSLITYAMMLIAAKLLYSGETVVLIYIVGAAEIINVLAQLFRYIFRSFERMGFEAIVTVMERFVVFALGLFMVMRGYGVIGFCMAVLVASILNFVVTSIIMIWKFTRPRFGLLDMRVCSDLLKQALPFALGGALYALYFRFDILMLKYMMGDSGDTAVGWYGTGYSFVTALTIIPGTFMGAIFPVMARMIKSSPTAMQILYTKAMKLMFVMALPIAVGVTFLADRIVLILYPENYFDLQSQEALTNILGILIWAGALIFLNFVPSTVLRAANRRRAFTIITTFGVSVNIVSNLILIPRYGHLGPTLSMVISESLIFLCGIWYIQKRVCKLSEVGFIPKTIFASGFLALGLIIWKYASGLGESIPIPIVICISVIVYLAFILAMRTVAREDLDMVRGQYPGI